MHELKLSKKAATWIFISLQNYIPRLLISEKWNVATSAHEMASTLEEIPEEEDQKSSTSVELTPYEKVLNAVHDQKLVHDIALEKRVGLYRFLGDIGRGNFSRVKKAIHLLTKGNFLRSLLKLLGRITRLIWL